MEEKNSISLTDRIWKMFSSIKLAVVVFTLISVTSIIGTLIQQQVEPERNIQMLGKIFGASAPAVYKVFSTLGFMDMYRSWWFLSLLFIFAANLVICSIDRLPGIWKLAKEPVKPLDADIFKSLIIRPQVQVKAKLSDARTSVITGLGKIGFKHVLTDETSGQIYAEKGRYSRLGVYVTHLSILFILLGGIEGKFFGFDGYLPLLEGTSASSIEARDGKQIPLGFSVRCDDFDVSFYDNSDTPKSFRSKLVVIDNNREVLKKDIEVNDPLRYKGVVFYQASYFFSQDHVKDAKFILKVYSKADNKSSQVDAGLEKLTEIPGTGLSLKIQDFSPAIGIDDKTGQLMTYANQMNNPAAFIEFFEGNKSIHKQWVLKRFPDTWKTPFGSVELVDIWGVQYTGLQVRKDPGVWLVYLGCLLMAAGLYAAFFMSHRRIWLRLHEEKGSTFVTVAGSTNKNKIQFDQKIDSFIKSLQQ
ncbi:MAG: cytochrome c biogenesis protein ResB [Nitrospiraceae bacterium]|nr:cytochrome c biogenesis protein ResB [Nitrospiraceae bacterium]